MLDIQISRYSPAPPLRQEPGWGRMETQKTVFVGKNQRRNRIIYNPRKTLSTPKSSKYDGTGGGRGEQKINIILESNRP